MASLNLSYPALHIDIVTMFVCGLTFMEYFAQYSYVQCSDSYIANKYSSKLYVGMTVHL